MSKDFSTRRRQYKSHSNFGLRFVWLIIGFFLGYLSASLFDLSSLQRWANKQLLHENAPLGGKGRDAVNSIQGTHDHPSHTSASRPKFEFYTLLSKDNSNPKPNHINALNDRGAIGPVSASAPTASLEKGQNHLNQAEILNSDEKNKSKSLARALEANHLIFSTSPNTQAEARVSRPQAPIPEAVPSSTAGRMDANEYKNKTRMASQTNYIIQVAAFSKRQDAERLKASLALTGFDVSVSSTVRQQVYWYRVSIGPFNSLQAAKKAQLVVYRGEHMKGIIRQV